MIAPRPLFIAAPALDWDNVQSDVIRCVNEVKKVYGIMDAESRLELFTPYNTNRWTTYYNPDSPRKEVFKWISKNFK